MKPSKDASARRILVVSHEASRTGAPRIAVLVTQSLIQRGHDVRVVLRRPGPLEDEFSDLAATRIEPLYRVRRRLWRWTRARWIAFAVDTALAMGTILCTRPDVVYLNSTASAVYLRPAIWMRRRVILHSHESAEVAHRFLDPVDACRLLRRTRLVACSSSVQNALSDVAGVIESEVELIPSVPDIESVRSLAAEGPAIPVSADEVVVGCCGSVEVRKGCDLWLQAERQVRLALPDSPVRFVWVGTVDDPALISSAPQGVFVGPASNPYPTMARFDIATLPSRDDPFPLVVLEAMALGKPVVAFAVGGVRDQIGSGGVVVEPGDVDAFASAIVNLVSDQGLRRELGDRARIRVETVYSVDRFRSAVVAVVEQT